VASITKVKVFDFKTSIYLYNFKTQKYKDDLKELENFKKNYEEALKIGNTERADIYKDWISRTQAEITQYENERDSIATPEEIEKMISDFLFNKNLVSVNVVSPIYKDGNGDTSEVHLIYTITYTESM